MPAGETEAHQHLKRLAFVWAIQNRYRIAGVEVSLPEFRRRLDVAAYRPHRWVRKPHSPSTRLAAGVTAVFECKQCRSDFLKDSKSVQATALRLQKLHERKLVYDEFLHRHWPSLSNRDSLFQEFESYDFSSIQYRPYEKLLAEIRSRSSQLHANTKFDRITTRRVANVHYVVAEPDVVQPHELPFGWGLMIRNGDDLGISVKPTWFDLSDDDRFLLLQRIALAGTRAGALALGIAFDWSQSPTISQKYQATD